MGYRHGKRKVCGQYKSYCTVKGLKAHLHAMSVGQIKRLAGSMRVGLHSKKTGQERTKKALINIFLKRKKATVARHLGVHLITATQKRAMRA